MLITEISSRTIIYNGMTLDVKLLLMLGAFLICLLLSFISFFNPNSLLKANGLRLFPLGSIIKGGWAALIEIVINLTQIIIPSFLFAKTYHQIQEKESDCTYGFVQKVLSVHEYLNLSSYALVDWRYPL